MVFQVIYSSKFGHEVALLWILSLIMPSLTWPKFKDFIYIIEQEFEHRLFILF